MFYIAKKWLHIKEKKLYCSCFSLFLNSEKLVLENYGKPLKYIFQTHYKFEKNKKLAFKFFQ
jgi:hypothetical protein